MDGNVVKMSPEERMKAIEQTVEEMRRDGDTNSRADAEKTAMDFISGGIDDIGEDVDRIVTAFVKRGGGKAGQ